MDLGNTETLENNETGVKNVTPLVETPRDAAYGEESGATVSKEKQRHTTLGLATQSDSLSISLTPVTRIKANCEGDCEVNAERSEGGTANTQCEVGTETNEPAETHNDPSQSLEPPTNFADISPSLSPKEHATSAAADSQCLSVTSTDCNSNDKSADNHSRSKDVTGESMINALFNSALTLESIGDCDKLREVSSSRDEAASRSNASSPASFLTNDRSSAPVLSAKPTIAVAEPPFALNPLLIYMNQVNAAQVIFIKLLEAFKDEDILSRFSSYDVKILMNEFASLSKNYESQLHVRAAIASVAFGADSNQQRRTPSSSSASAHPILFGVRDRVLSSAAENPPKTFETQQFGVRQSIDTYPPPQIQYGPPLSVRKLSQLPAGKSRAFNF